MAHSVPYLGASRGAGSPHAELVKPVRARHTRRAARMVKLVDTKDLKSFGLTVHAGSTPAPGTKPGCHVPASRAAWLVVAAAVLWLACAAAFVLPGQTLDWGRDLFVFFGQINALEHGQVPYRDFRTSMGALPFYLPWLGYRLVGSYAGALELGGLLATALLLPCVVVALRARFGLPTALALLLCLTATVAAPFDHGFQLPSHVGFYNRWCASALTALFLFVVPPRQRANATVTTIEGTAIAALLLFLFFTKASYFAVGFAFTVGFGAVLGMFRQAALIGAAVFALVVGVAHGATGLILDYVAELAHSSEVSALSWYGRDRFLKVYLPRSLSYYGVLAIAGAFAAYGRARLGWRHWAFVAYALLACLAIQGHDAGFHGPFPLVAPLALLGERAAWAWRRWHLGLLALFMLPYLAALPRATFKHEARASPVELPGMAGIQAIDISNGHTEPNNVKHLLLFVAKNSPLACACYGRTASRTACLGSATTTTSHPCWARRRCPAGSRCSCLAGRWTATPHPRLRWYSATPSTCWCPRRSTTIDAICCLCTASIFG